MAGTRSPGTRIPTRFRGSAADKTIVSPVGILRVARNDSTATGKRELFAEKAVYETSTANLATIFQPTECHLQFAPLGKLVSRASRSRKTTP